MQGVLVVQDVLTSSPGPLNPLFEGVVYIGWAWYILDGRSQGSASIRRPGDEARVF